MADTKKKSTEATAGKGASDEIPAGAHVKVTLWNDSSLEATFAGMSKGEEEVYDLKSTPDKDEADFHVSKELVESIEVV